MTKKIRGLILMAALALSLVATNAEAYAATTMGDDTAIVRGGPLTPVGAPVKPIHGQFGATWE